ncbi:MAG: cytokinin riboside 5'-monophosphate phosphoribohydrolase [Phycisphaerae bacterium]
MPDNDGGGPNHQVKRASPEEAWRLFRIMAEFVDGFDTMSRVSAAVSIFGSARTPRDHPRYLQAMQLAARLVREGFTIVTGGGPGIMEAANRGAFEAGGTSVGLNIVLPREQRPNAYQNVRLDFDYFFARKVMFVRYAVAVVCFPGGFGTLDEMFETLVLIQTHRTKQSPVILIGRDFWFPLVEWVRTTLLEEHGAINPEDFDLFFLTDDIEEAAARIIRNYREEGVIWQPPRRVIHPDSADEGG